MRPTKRLLYLLALLLPLSLYALYDPAGLALWKLGLATLAVGTGYDLLRLMRTQAPEFERRLSGSIPVGVWSEVELTLANPTSQGLILSVHDHHPTDFEFEGLPLSLLLTARRKLSLSYRIRPQRRGDGLFAGVDILLRSPLGLWRQKRFIERAQLVRVFPNFREVINYAKLALDNDLSQIGVRQWQRRGEGSDFEQLREYRVGDSLRSIDWKATSRYRKLISKEYQDERDQQLVFLLDCGRQMRHRNPSGAHLDHALNAMLLLSYVASRQGDGVGFLAFGGELRWQPPRKGEGLIRRLLERTYDLDSTLEASDYLLAARHLMPLQRRRALVIVLTNSREEDQAELSRAIALLSRRHLVVLVELRETALQQALEEPIDGLDKALRYQGVMDYLYTRAQGLEALRRQGVRLLDVLPDQLSVRLVNTYLDIKSSRVL